MSSPPPHLLERFRDDGISLPAIATRLRKWMRRRGDVQLVVIGHTGKRYTVAVLMQDATISRAARVRLEIAELVQFAEWYGPDAFDVFIVGPEHHDAPMFTRAGSYPIYPPADLRPAAAA